MGLYAVLCCCAFSLVLAACASLERDAVVDYAWNKRGQAVGEGARLYCYSAGDRQRQMMRWAIGMASGGARVHIDCPDDPLTGPVQKR